MLKDYSLQKAARQERLAERRAGKRPAEVRHFSISGTACSFARGPSPTTGIDGPGFPMPGWHTPEASKDAKERTTGYSCHHDRVFAIGAVHESASAFPIRFLTGGKGWDMVEYSKLSGEL